MNQFKGMGSRAPEVQRRSKYPPMHGRHGVVNRWTAPILATARVTA
jgi:hypothetical protein